MGLHVRRRPDFPARLAGWHRQGGAARGGLQGDPGGAQWHAARPGGRCADSDRRRPSADSGRAIGDAAHLHRGPTAGQRVQACRRGGAGSRGDRGRPPTLTVPSARRGTEAHVRRESAGRQAPRLHQAGEPGSRGPGGVPSGSGREEYGFPRRHAAKPGSRKEFTSGAGRAARWAARRISRRAGENRNRGPGGGPSGSAWQERAATRGHASQEPSRCRAALESVRRHTRGRADSPMTYSGERILLSSQREGQVSRFRKWVFLVVPLVAILFQVYVPMFFPFLSFLEMPLLVVVYFAIMRRSQISGLMVGALVGLAQDSLSKNPLGMFGIVKTLVGYFAASVGVRLDVEHGLIRLLLGFFFFVFHQFLYWVMSRALLGQQMTFDWPRTAMLAALNAVVGVALFHFLDKLKERA